MLWSARLRAGLRVRLRAGLAGRLPCMGLGLGLGAFLGLAACTGAGDPDGDLSGRARADTSLGRAGDIGVQNVEFLEVQVQPLDDDLVGFLVSARGPGAERIMNDYARCAAAGYTQRKGFGFARQVRTNLRKEGGVWLADAVYTISPALPRGLMTIDAEVVAADCAERGIPTV